MDIELSKMDGKIKQGRTPNCNHKGEGACIYCTSKDPYDPEYLGKEGIKFMSFHSYLRKLDHEKGSLAKACLLYTSPSPRDATLSRMPSSA